MYREAPVFAWCCPTLNRAFFQDIRIVDSHALLQVLYLCVGVEARAVWA